MDGSDSRVAGAPADQALSVEAAPDPAMLLKRISQLEQERDAALQEMYESNRFASTLARERQTLIDGVYTHAGRQNVNLGDMLTAMEKSTSWRITAPLRAIRRAMGAR